jgi:hypothetical protein
MQILDGGYTTLRNQSKEELQLKGSGDQTFRQSDVFVLCYVSSGTLHYAINQRKSCNSKAQVIKHSGNQMCLCYVMYPQESGCLLQVS